MDKQTTLTDLDKIIMDIIWEHSDVSAPEIRLLLEDSHNLTRDTIKAYIKRLIDKGMVGVRQISQRKNRFFPLITKQDFVSGNIHSILKQNNQGLAHVVAGLVKNNNITSEDIDELEHLIKNYKEARE